MSKYFKLFSTLAAHNAVYNDWSDQSTYNEPWVSFIEEGTGTVTYNRPGVTLSYNAFLDPKNYDPEKLIILCTPGSVFANKDDNSGSNNSGDSGSGNSGGIVINPGGGSVKPIDYDPGGGSIVIPSKPNTVPGYFCTPYYFENGIQGIFDLDDPITEFRNYEEQTPIIGDNFDIPSEFDVFDNVAVVIEDSNILTVDGQSIPDMETTEIIITDGDELLFVLRSNGEYEKYWIHQQKV